MTNPLNSEPALLAGAVMAVLQVVVIVGWLELNVDELAAISIALTSVLALFVRSKVKPV